MRPFPCKNDLMTFQRFYLVIGDRTYNSTSKKFQQKFLHLKIGSQFILINFNFSHTNSISMTIKLNNIEN